MCCFHKIQIQTSNGSLDTLTIKVEYVLPPSNDSYNTLGVGLWDPVPARLTVSGVGFHGRVFVGGDMFEALIALRKELEKTGCLLLCVGGRVDAYASGMCREMGGAGKVYITQLGKHATKLFDIFGKAKPETCGTVEQQKEFHRKWVCSLDKLRKLP